MREERIPTGVPGLDIVLHGGYPGRALHLLVGPPGAGKTTTALQFLAEGARRGERCLYLGLSETCGAIQRAAASLGIELRGIDIHELRSRRRTEEKGSTYTVFPPTEVELEAISQEISEHMNRARPERVVLDSLSEIRLVADDPFRYRRTLLELMDYTTALGCTALATDLVEDGLHQSVAETLLSGVIHLEHVAQEYGGDRRRLRVRKLRASSYVGGYHDLRIDARGIRVFPRLVPSKGESMQARRGTELVPSGVAALDALLGGGLPRGTSTVLMGVTGTGKSTVAMLFAASMASRGERSIVLCFDEHPGNFLARSAQLGTDLPHYVGKGIVELVDVNPAEYSPGELAHLVREAVAKGCRLVVIDSLNGYVGAMPEERLLTAHMHELLTYLTDHDVVTLLTVVQHGLIGVSESPLDIDYLSDAVVLFRFFEVAGELKQALSVIKKRIGHHERAIRELKISSKGVDVGEPLLQVQGVLAGQPQIVGPRPGDNGRHAVGGGSNGSAR